MTQVVLWYIYGVVLTMSVPLIASAAFALKKPAGPRERAFILRFVLVIHSIAILFLLLLFLAIGLVPGRWAFLVWVAYPPMVLLPVWSGLRRQARIRADEAGK